MRLFNCLFKLLHLFQGLFEFLLAGYNRLYLCKQWIDVLLQLFFLLLCKLDSLLKRFDLIFECIDLNFWFLIALRQLIIYSVKFC